MYAVIELGGKQYRVKQGDEVIVDRLDVAEGKTMTMVPMLLGGEKKAITVAELKGAKVKAKVEEHLLGDKIRVFTYKPKRGFKKMKGHRSRLSRVSIQAITTGKKKAAAAATPEKAEMKEAGKPAKGEAAEAPKAKKAAEKKE